MPQLFLNLGLESLASQKRPCLPVIRNLFDTRIITSTEKMIVFTYHSKTAQNAENRYESALKKVI